MGCDIHLALERNYKGQWVGVPIPNVTAARSRNYELFALLAGVRGDGPEPKGIPDDTSGLSQIEIDRWDGDGHSHSWCSLQEYVEACMACMDNPATLLKDDDPIGSDPYGHYFGLGDKDDDPDFDKADYRVVFWFDN
jgi:hypothetical protein